MYICVYKLLPWKRNLRSLSPIFPFRVQKATSNMQLLSVVRDTEGGDDLLSLQPDKGISQIEEIIINDIFFFKSVYQTE